MISNLEAQLEPIGLIERMDEILEEAGRVRADLGYPIVVSPFAQFIVTQAVLNVMSKERYASVPDEVRRYVLGGYGEIPGKVDPDLYDRITRGAEPSTDRPGSLVAPAVERLRREQGPFQSDDDLLLAAFYNRSEYDALKAAGPIDTDYPLASTPWVTLVKELTQRRGVRNFHFIRRGEPDGTDSNAPRSAAEPASTRTGDR
jgi:oxaloacetate decarboxylase alpha subunit